MIALLFLILAPMYGFFGILIWSLIFDCRVGRDLPARSVTRPPVADATSRQCKGSRVASYDVARGGPRTPERGQMLSGCGRIVTRRSTQ